MIRLEKSLIAFDPVELSNPLFHMDIHERVILLDLKIQLAEDEKCLSVLKILKVGIPQDIGQPDHNRDNIPYNYL